MLIQKLIPAEIGILSALRINLTEGVAALMHAGIAATEFTPPNDAVAEAMLDLWQSGHAFDSLAIITRLEASGRKVDHGWGNHLRATIYEGGAFSVLPDYIETFLHCRAARRLYALGESLVAGSLVGPVEPLITEARAVLDGTMLAAPTLNTRLATLLAAAIDSITAMETGAHVIEFGLGLDEHAGPFCRGDLVIIAGETKKGKSALAGNIVEHVAARGKRVTIFSLEMTGVQTAERMLASQARVDIRSMKLRMRMMGQRELTTQDDREMTSLHRAVSAMKDWPVDVIERVDSIGQIVAEIVRIKPDLAVIDYGQLVEGLRSKGDSREREVASISRALKRAAVECNCVVILLSQINDDGRLRESRALGQDANAVLFIEGDSDHGMHVRVGAARSAPTGTEIPIAWSPQFTRFSIP